MSDGRRDGSISHLILFLTGNTLRLELEYCGTNVALLRVIMKNEDAPAELDAFEQESHRLLLAISLQQSTRELRGIVNKPKRHSLPTYYKELQEWRTPIVVPSQQKKWEIVPRLDAT